MVTVFTLDTSGYVYVYPPRSPRTGNVLVQVRLEWWNLDAFTQGAFTEAARQAVAAGIAEAGAFRNWSPEALAMILADCAADQKVGHALNLAGNTEDRTSREAGRKFWIERQTGNLFDCPPLTVSLDDDGKVKLEVKAPLAR